MAFLGKIKAFLNKDSKPPGGFLYNPSDPIRGDGVPYTPPPMVTEAEMKSLSDSGQLQKYLKESIAPTWGSSVASYDIATRFQFDYPYKKDAPVNIPIDNPLYEWNSSTRRYIAELCHGAYLRNPDARALNHIANFAVGQGFQLTALNPDIREFLDEFIDHPETRVREYERQAAKDLLIDGEIILEWMVTGTGMPVFVPKRPYECVGIKTEEGHYRKLKEFEFAEVQDEGQGFNPFTKFEIKKIPAENITFVAINNRAYELRGRSELFPILMWLKTRQDWLENRARVNHFKSSVMWMVRVASNNAKTIMDVAARWARPPKPGASAVESENVSVETVSPNIQGRDAVDDGRQLLLQIAKSFNIPEYFMSDGHNANLASASRQQLPALVRFEEHQKVLVDELWIPLFRKAIQIQVSKGLIPEEVAEYNSLDEPTGEMIKAIDAFNVSYQPVIEEDLKELTESLEIQVRTGLTSKRMARQTLGYDADQVEADLDEEGYDGSEEMDDPDDADGDAGGDAGGDDNGDVPADDDNVDEN